MSKATEAADDYDYEMAMTGGRQLFVTSEFAAHAEARGETLQDAATKAFALYLELPAEKNG
jgi:hypothetical protein